MALIINLERTSLVIQALCECDCLRVSKLSSVLFLNSRSRVIEYSGGERVNCERVRRYLRAVP